MSKLAPTSTKYVIRASIKAMGVVEKPDIIGAVFGQTEGLLGSELDLRELQRTGRIGRIDVKIKSVKGKSEGEILIPSSLDAAETSLIAATLETIERVGPCTATIKLVGVEDTRSDKRKYVVEKAKEILKNLSDRGVPDSSEISEQIKEAVRTEEIVEVFGLAAGPNVIDSEEIVIVEGRADVLNLIKFGIRNTIAIEGTSVSKSVVELAKRKTSTLFIDGDRGGQLIAKELLQKTDLDYIAVAPEGKEVEELSQKEAYKALRDKVLSGQFFDSKRKPPVKETAVRPALKVEDRPYRSAEPKAPRTAPSRRFTPRGTEREGPARRDHARRDERPRSSRLRIGEKERSLYRKTIGELVGTRAAYIFNDKDELLGKVPVSELENTLRTIEDPHAVIFDGKVSFRINELAKRKGVKFLVGMEKDDFYSPVMILSRKDLEKQGSS